MSDNVQVVKQLMGRMQKHIAEFPDAPNVDRTINDIAALGVILSDVQEFYNRTVPVDSELGDISHLPPELIKELTLNAPSELEQRIIAIIESTDEKLANINTILVALYDRHKVVQKRRNMQNKLWRMMDNKLLYSMPNQKGVYTTIKPVSYTHLTLPTTPYV